MSNTAENLENLEPVTTAGLEELFESAPVPTSADECQEPVATDAEPVPVDVAAPVLNTSVNALKKQLRKGTIKGIKKPFKHGEKWFVDPSELPEGFNINHEPVKADAKECQEPVATDAEPVTADAEEYQEPVATDAEPVTADAEECQEPITTDAEPVLDTSSEQFEMIRELQTKIEALTFRNGYLESKLEDRETQIKLLTDRENDRPGWIRAFKWFWTGSLFRQSNLK